MLKLGREIATRALASAHTNYPRLSRPRADFNF